MLDGVFVFNKPRGFTSFDAVAKLRGILKTRKIGHAGTLDPMAEGVLVILVGNATKAADYILTQEKTYRGGFRLGTVSDTLDIWGRCSETGAPLPDGDAVKAALLSFEGGYMQTPPMYSAIQKNGVRLYDLARQGIEVQRESRFVDIKALTLASFDGREGVFTLTCSKGTYIRSLCHDLGERLGCGAVMSSLVRTASGDFLLSGALTFQQLEELASRNELEKAILPTGALFAHLPQMRLTDEGLKRALNGAYIDKTMLLSGEIPQSEGALCALCDKEGLLATLARAGRLAVGGRSALFFEKSFYPR